MRFISSIGSVFVLFALITIIESKDFCDAFADNDYKISYGFRYLFKGLPPYNHYAINYLIIGQTYWQLIYIDDFDDINKLVKITTESNGTSDWFGSQYSMGFSLGWQKLGTAGLVNKAKDSIEWNEIDANMNIIPNTSKTAPTNVHNRDGLPIVAFTPHWSSEQYYIVVFVCLDQTSTYRYYIRRITDDLQTTEDTGGANPNRITPTALDGWKSNYTTIAILAEYSQQDANRKHEGHGMIVMFQNDKTILYCYANISSRGDLCLDANLKTLISCPAKGIPFVVIIIGIAVVVVILVLALVFIYCFCIRAKKENIAEKKSEPKLNTEPKSEPKLNTEPKSEPKLNTEPKSEPKLNTEPKSEPKSKSVPDLSAEPK